MKAEICLSFIVLQVVVMHVTPETCRQSCMLKEAHCTGLHRSMSGWSKHQNEIPSCGDATLLDSMNQKASGNSEGMKLLGKCGSCVQDQNCLQY